MIVNIVFHGAWIFVISEMKQRIFAYAPDESQDHKYRVGSISGNTLKDFYSGDYVLLGINGGKSTWSPNNEYSPVISAKRQKLKRVDPSNQRYCYISMPLPEPGNIFPLEPYDTVSFLQGQASSEVTNLKQFPSVHCFVYQCPSLQDLRLESTEYVVAPDIPANQSPYQQTANLHILATYWDENATTATDQAQMERCFSDMTNLLYPGLDLSLVIDPNKKINAIGYALPPGLTKSEVELTKAAPEYGPGHNCQNANFFLNETDGMELP
jgi:hypothetical protein